MRKKDFFKAAGIGFLAGVILTSAGAYMYADSYVAKQIREVSEKNADDTAEKKTQEATEKAAQVKADQAETDAQKVTEVQAETDAQKVTEVQAETDAQKVTEVQAETDAQKVTEVQAGTDAQNATEADEDDQPEAAPEVKPGNKAEKSSDAEAGTQTEMQTEKETAVQEIVTVDIREDEQLRAIYDNCIASREANGQNWSVSIVDLSNGQTYGYRENEVMQSASVLKLFIMGAVYDRVIEPADESLRINYVSSYDGEVHDLLHSMITVSDNYAANRLVEILGSGDFSAGTAVLAHFCGEHGFFGTSMGRRFMSFDSASDNYTCAADTSKILSMIYNGTLVSEASSQEMLSYLKQQERRWKIPAGLPEGYSSANKTGEIDGEMGFVENDTAIVFGPEKDYVLCVLSSNLNGDNGGAQYNIQSISQITAGILK